jgi:hypothetical protein
MRKFRLGRCAWASPAAAGLVAALLVLSGCGGGSSGKSKSRPQIAVGPRIAWIPGARFDPSSVDKIARRGRYSAWVQLEGDGHVCDLAVWPSQSAAKHAVERYRAGGPDTRPLGSGSYVGSPPAGGYPVVVRRIDRIRNVTLAWYSRPTSADEAAFRGALRFQGGNRTAGDYTGIWAIVGAHIEPYIAVAYQDASYNLDVVLAGGCIAGVCTGEGGGCVPDLNNDLDIAIWPSRLAAESYVHKYTQKGVLEPERIRNATIDWYCHPTSADEAVVRAALR